MLVGDLPRGIGLDRLPDTHASRHGLADDSATGPGIEAPSRPLIVCDNLEVSEDGKRIYFTEPFDYTGASVDDALDEALALSPNGRMSIESSAPSAAPTGLSLAPIQVSSTSRVAAVG